LPKRERGKGAIRVLLIVPLLGEFNALLLEVPIMLALSWIACMVRICPCQ
jgi:hypothetical protein